MIGRSVSHYQITDQLGQGGMGVVYKATDTKLDRHVALKFLPTHTLPSDDDRQRFEREARAAASLNHPNIATVYEIDETDEGKAFIAMELVEGETLADKIKRGPLKLEEAIHIASQIAEGLAAAHEKDIVHRDIKASNVMLTEKGQVKIMDFGLAKMAEASMLTVEGTTLGTVYYMSPEQARGEEVDHRADLWALGVVLYEMVSGQLPFSGDYNQAVIYSLLNVDPEALTGLRTGVPMELERIVAKLLMKDRSLRYQSAVEIPADLKAISLAKTRATRLSTVTTTRPAIAPVEPPGRRSPKMPWAVAGVMTLVALGILLWGLTQAGGNSEEPVRRLTVSISPAANLDGGPGQFAISPDGSQVVFAGWLGFLPQLFLRSLDEIEAMPLAGTERANAPFFSPDGQWIGFFKDGQLMKVSVNGGAPIPICQALNSVADWGPDDQIIFSTPGQSGRFGMLLRVSAQGGEPETIPITASDSLISAYNPKFLPDGQGVLFERVSTYGTSASENIDIVVFSLESGAQQTLIRGGRFPHYISTGHLVFDRLGTIMAVPFDPKRLVVTGPEVPVMSDVYYVADDGFKTFALSNDGTLLYMASGETEHPRQMTWVDREGISTPILTESHLYHDPRISPDGERIAVFARDSGVEVWVYEHARQTLMRITDNPGEDETVVWSPDGQWLAYAASKPTSPRGIYRRAADGSGTAEVLWVGSVHAHIESWTPDGQSLIFSDRDRAGQWDIWVLDLEDTPTARPLIQTRFEEFAGQVSPDGRWLAYVSDETGRQEIYVQAYPGLGQKVPVSTGGGTQPMWSASGRHLYYRGEGQVMEVAIAPGERFLPGVASPLFADRFAGELSNHTSYDVLGEGERFLMIEGGDRGRAHLDIVLNWFEVLKDRMPTD